MSDNFASLLRLTKNQDYQALARLLSVLELQGPKLLKHSELLNPPHQAFRIGITGPPGAGKSTLIGQLILELRKRNLKVAVLAVDPSSPFSKGAILGDRIRFSDSHQDPRVFVRSIGSRGSLGGLSAAAYLMVRALDLAKFDVVLIETVGVGQTELEIMNVADHVTVVLVPESGDSVQAMKAGLLEIADLFLVNKADRDGAGIMAKELEESVTISNQLLPSNQQKKIPVLQSVATQGQGVRQLVDELLSRKNLVKNRNSAKRLQAEAKALLRMKNEKIIEVKSSKVETLKDLKNLVT